MTKIQHTGVLHADCLQKSGNKQDIFTRYDKTEYAHIITSEAYLRVSFSQIGISITEGNTAFVHHTLVYLCSGLDNALVGQGAPCDSAHIAIQLCRTSYVFGTWALGGSVSLIFLHNVKNDLAPSWTMILTC